MAYGSVIRIESSPVRLRNALEILSDTYGIKINETEIVPMGSYKAETGEETIFEDREIAKLGNEYFSATVDFSLQSFFGSGEARISLDGGDAAEFYGFVENLKKAMRE